MSILKEQEITDEYKDFVRRYYAREKLQRSTDQLWAHGVLTDEQLDLIDDFLDQLCGTDTDKSTDYFNPNDYPIMRGDK